MSGTRPRLLDLFCGAGGAAMGYHRAGFDVTGIDVEYQRRYPFDFAQADAIAFLERGIANGSIRAWDVIHASPPCQAYTVAQNAAQNREAHPDLIGPVRQALRRAGKPYVIENVVGAPLISPAVMCGLALGLKVKRHRLFESNLLLLTPSCPNHDQEYFVVFGNEVRSRRHGKAAGRKNKAADGKAAMGIEWMTRRELSEAIPPAYTEFIGRQLIAAITAKEER